MKAALLIEKQFMKTEEISTAACLMVIIDRLIYSLNSLFLPLRIF